jgi:hypothetical protein
MMELTQSGKIIGISTRHYPTQASAIGQLPVILDGDVIDQSANPPPIRFVLVSGAIGDYACYAGIGTPDWVAKHGDKISFSEACLYFMDLEKEKYRR